MEEGELLYISDSGNNCIQVFNLGGDHVLTIGELGSDPGQFSSPRGLFFSKDRNVLLVAGGL